MDAQRGLNIAALAKRTGVAPDTLRKWEQRYGILSPPRTSGGQRRYTELDVARVEWLRDRVADGLRIGEAAALLGPADVPPPDASVDLVGAMYNAALASDAPELERLLDHVFSLHSLEEVCRDIIPPLLVRIGEGWAKAELSVAQEHLVTSIVRGRLESRLLVARGGVRGTAVLACVPGERHDLGLLMAATLLRADGWNVLYLGADSPLADTFALADSVNADLVGLSVTMAANLAGIAAANKNGRRVVLGGSAATAKAARALGADHLDSDVRLAIERLRELSE